jgi:hypothetical protein
LRDALIELELSTSLSEPQEPLHDLLQEDPSETSVDPSMASVDSSKTTVDPSMTPVDPSKTSVDPTIEALLQKFRYSQELLKLKKRDSRRINEG